MSTFWGPGVDAEIGYRMEQTRRTFTRGRRGRRSSTTVVRRPWPTRETDRPNRAA